MEHVTAKELDAILTQDLSVELCPKCGSTPQITMPLTFFERDGLKIECRHCGYGTDLQRIHTMIADETRLSTPIIPKGIVRAIYDAVGKWNKNAVCRGERQ